MQERGGKSKIHDLNVIQKKEFTWDLWTRHEKGRNYSTKISCWRAECSGHEKARQRWEEKHSCGHFQLWVCRNLTPHLPKETCLLYQILHPTNGESDFLIRDRGMFTKLAQTLGHKEKSRTCDSSCVSLLDKGRNILSIRKWAYVLDLLIFLKLWTVVECFQMPVIIYRDEHICSLDLLKLWTESIVFLKFNHPFIWNQVHLIIKRLCL